MSEAVAVVEQVVELEGLAVAEQALELAEGRRDALQGSLDRARAALQAAEGRRGQLVAKVSAGDGEAGKASVALAREITDRAAEVTLLAEALPGAMGAVRKAQRGVDAILGAEKRRRAALARAAFREAEARVVAETAAMNAAWTAWQIAERGG